jgi:thiol:disulfide interchange protein
VQLIKQLLSVVLLACAALPAWAAHTQVQLLLGGETARPGDTVLAGVRLQMEPGWHTYWRNPGASGMATTLDWELPPGVTAQAPQWPVPEKLPDADFTTYIYSNEVVLLVPLKLAPDLHPGPLNLKVKASWLECKESCIPGDGTAEAQLTVGPETKPSKDAAVLQTWQKRLPQPATSLAARAWWEKATSTNQRPFILEWNTPAPVADADFFPDSNEHWEVQGPTAKAPAPAGKSALRKEVKKSSGDWPQRLSGVLVETVSGEQRAYAIDVPVDSSNMASAAATTPTEPVALWRTLLYAFLGGLILNVMPCVLPVIALKILGFVNQAKDHPRRVRTLGLIYASGVLASFLALALLIIAAKAAGSAAGWGFQFGNRYFLLAMTTLVTLVALNLFGVFEITLSGRAMSAASGLSSKHGAAGAFFNGLLATVLATSCSAPYLGVAIGFAFAQGTAVIVLVMLTVGLGLAAPYLLLSWNPQWLRFLPRPGSWMEKFKIAMGFPMLAAAVWLCSLLETHYGERVWWMAVFLVFVALAAWVYGEFVQRGTKRRLLGAAVTVILLLTGYLFAAEHGLQWRAPFQPTSGSAAASEAPTGVAWQPWSPQAVAEAQNAGQPVLIDFTAKWCLTCNTVIKPALESSAVQQKLKDINARALLANYTRQPADLTAELKRFGRAGVPLVVIYSRNPSTPPMVFDVVTPSSLLSALDRAAQ